MEMVKNLLSGITLQPETIPNWLVVVMGVGTVFVGLIAIIIICKIMSLFFIKRKEEVKTAAVTSAPAAQKSEVIENRQEIIAAVCAACAEDMGTDISALRVVSFNKI